MPSGARVFKTPQVPGSLGLLLCGGWESPTNAAPTGASLMFPTEDRRVYKPQMICLPRLFGVLTLQPQPLISTAAREVGIVMTVLCTRLREAKQLAKTTQQMHGTVKKSPRCALLSNMMLALLLVEGTLWPFTPGRVPFSLTLTLGGAATADSEGRRDRN